MSAARILCLAVFVTACAGPRRAELSAKPPASAAALDLDPAFRSLRAAIDDGDDASARAILWRMRAMAPSSAARETLDAFDRILDGRAVARTIELRLFARGADARGRRTLSLAIVPHRDGRLKLCAAAARLSSLVWGVDPRGYEHRSARSEPRDELAELALSGNEPKIVDLVQFDVPLANDLAVRARFDLELVEPEVELDGRRLPASSLRVEPCEVVSLAKFLPSGAVEPEELVRCISRPSFPLAAALERTVRIAPERRAEALDLLEPAIATMNRVDLERAVPCLRWLSGDRDLGGDPDLWRRWIEARARERAARERGPELDLPRANAETPERSP
jgi:hypothetical protein